VSVTHPMPLHRPLAVLLAAALFVSVALPLIGPSAVRAQSSDLFISEYIEGSSFNKAIEIYNGTGAAVDLTAGGYRLELYTNGSSAVSQAMSLTGTLADDDVLVIAHGSAASEILAVTDVTNAVVINFSGNDALVLRAGGAGGTVIDAIGQVGFDPGAQWGIDPVSTTNNTIRRKATVTDGDTVETDAFDPSAEWDGFAENTFDGLGSHTVGDGPSDPTGVGAATPGSVMAGETTLLTVAVTPGANPTSTGLAVTADLGPIGGIAGQAFADDGLNGDAVAGDLTFSFLATVGAVGVGDKVITATITDDLPRDNTALISLTVAGEPSEIAEIQGAGHLSPLDGEDVFGVEGVVTVSRSNSFWMTDPTPDGDDATSDSILVFGATAAIGSLVRVDGTVDEFRPGGSGGFENLTTTEIVSPTVTVVSTGHDLPTTVIGVDRLPPTAVIDDDSTTSVEASDAVFDPANDGIDFWESLEGARLQVADAVAVGPRNGFGEIAVISQLQADAGLRTPRGGILVRDPERDGNYQPGDFNPERVILDDVLAPTPMVNTGDEFTTDPVGVLDYGFGNYKLLVTANPGREDNGLAREVTAPQGPRDLAVATFNVENLSVVNDQAKFDDLAGQIVDNLRSPDLIGIEEMQDDSGPANNGVVSAAAGWQRLIDSIVAAGGPVYEFRSIDPVNNEDGGAPGANIRVGFLFRTDRGLEFVDRAVPGANPAITDTDVVPTPNGKWAQLTMSPGRVLDAALGGDKAFEDTRKSLAGEFRWRGETLFVVVNHLSSKGDDRPLFGHFQPPFRLTEFESGDPEDGWRHAQAQAINDFVDEIVAVDEDANVVVLGDINDFDFSETVQILTGERRALDPGEFMPDADGSGQTELTGDEPVLTTLFDLLPENERYSYVFDGNSQVLDQILVSGSILAEDPVYDVVHVNAEFFDQVSDHDPSVMRVAFQPTLGR
jgi:predicted extracellular nuclease